MAKPFVVVSCPIDTFSGYGARSRDIVKALFKTEKYDIKILPQRWGSTPYGALNPEIPEEKQILDNYYPAPQLQSQPDVWIQITVPNEFQPVGKYNVGITAGIETTLCAPTWLEGVNRMDLTLVSSEHAKKVFEDSKFEKRNKATNQLEGNLTLEKPIKVLFEGADLNKYFPIADDDLPDDELVLELDEIKEDFNFLFVGHWLPGGMGEDRKNVSLMIRLFLEVFKNKKEAPGLILKTSHGPSSIMDREEILKKVDAIRNEVKATTLPNIYLLHGELEDEQINYLYNHPKVKAMLSFTKGEGFGRPLLEFTLTQKPLLASGWSGHLDFLDPEFANLIPGEVKQVDKSAVNEFLLEQGGWFNIDQGFAVKLMEDVYKNYKNYIPKAKQLAFRNKNNFSLEKMTEKLDTIFEALIPKKVELVLPKIDKIELPK
jgi:glycosyltransferase involved in cell wall biosynthesis